MSNCWLELDFEYETDKKRRLDWSLNRFLDWLDPQIEELLELQKEKWRRRHQNKIEDLTMEFGNFLYQKWLQMKYQPLGRNGKLEFWKWWADFYDIDSHNFDYIWEYIFY